MTDGERHEYSLNKSIGQTCGIGLAMLVPFNAVMGIWYLKDRAYYAKRFGSVLMYTGFVGAAYLWSTRQQNKHLDSLYFKYFHALSDQELVNYHAGQNLIAQERKEYEKTLNQRPGAPGAETWQPW